MLPTLEKLVQELIQLPTIGKKTAWRIALYLLEQKKEAVFSLAQSIQQLKEKVMVCRNCFNYSEEYLCPICASKERTDSIICIVEKPLDVFVLERSSNYKGKYHILGGLLSPIHGITADKLSIAQLRERIQKQKPEEIILGLSGSSDAETTTHYLIRILTPFGITLTRFARGLPAGVDLEYIDQLTLNHALQERIPLVTKQSLE